MGNTCVTKLFGVTVISTLLYLILNTHNAACRVAAPPGNTILISYSTKCMLNKEKDNVVLRSINEAASAIGRSSSDFHNAPLEFTASSHSDSNIATTKFYTISGKVESTRSSDDCSFEDTWLKYTNVQLLNIYGNCERVGKDRIMDKLSNEECVVSYELDSVRYPSSNYNTEDNTVSPRTLTEEFSPNDFYFSKSWYYDPTNRYNMNVQSAWAVTKGGSGTVAEQPDNTIAVIDFGFMTDHPDLITQWYKNPVEACDKLGENGVDEDSNGFIDDCSGWNVADDSNDLAGFTHGTKVAGVLGSATDNRIGVSSICHKCKMLPIKILGKVSSEIIAINYAISKGVKVVNLSIGGNWSEAEFNLIAANPSVLFVTSAGNESCNLDTIETVPCVDGHGVYAGYPAASSDVLPNLISVGSYASYGEVDAFSNYGSRRVQVMAPGSNLYTTGYSGTTPNYTQRSGTSYSAPMVSSLLGMVHQMYPNLSACQLKEILILSCKTVVTVVGKNTCDGIADAGAALCLAGVIARRPGILQCSSGPTGENSKFSSYRSKHGVRKAAPNNTCAQKTDKSPTAVQGIKDKVANINDNLSNVIENIADPSSKFDMTLYTDIPVASSITEASNMAIMAKLIQLVYPLVSLMIQAPITMMLEKKLMGMMPAMLKANTTLAMDLSKAAAIGDKFEDSR